MDKKIRMLMAKPGLDGHDRGAKVVTLGLRDAGIEVIYTGLHQSPEMIVQAAIQEGADVIGLSCLSGAHKYLFSQVMELLRESNAVDILVVGGGTIPKEDIPYLLEKGIKAIFTTGTPVKQIVEYIKGVKK